MYGSPTTKEIKKKHSPRLVGGVEMGNRWRGLAARLGRLWLIVELDRQGSSWRTRLQTEQPRAPAQGKKASNL